MTTTLDTLRDRIRVQLESASGLTEPMIVSQSSAALEDIRDRVEARLQDVTNDRWSTAALDEAIRTALEQFSKYTPDQRLTTLTLTEDGREFAIPALPGLLRLEKVWWDYDTDDPQFPPNFRQFEVWPGPVLFIDDRAIPQAGDTVRILYTAMHTIEDLDGAAETTLPLDDEGTLVTGACHFAAHSRAVELAEEVTAHKDVYDQLRKYADEAGRNFRFQAQMELRQYVQRARAYPQQDIDEAIRWCLFRYSAVHPHRATATLTVTEAGREIDISSLSYLDVERVWLEYDSADPAYPPSYVDFEVWPGDILFINETVEARADSAVRIWYTTEHAIQGLDGAAADTLTARDLNIVVIGAAGFCAEERIQDPETFPWGSRALRDWGERRLKEFEDALAHVARREGARHSGMAPTGPLDRWDDTWA